MGDRAGDLYRRIDWFLIACLVMVVAFGAVFVASAATLDRPRLAKHLLWIAVGLSGLVCATRLDYRVAVRYGYSIYAVCVVALVVVLFMRPVNYASSWFDFGLFNFIDYPAV